ncbi:MAG: TetR/AcrR family transcriptional regulator, partial [Bacilli bacterium]|nr:TetR/AcrR family transcriptional regulator [Bacilli bacterium]
MDRRVRYTKNVIKETLISLLSEKKINKITVTEVCKIADINRATFYRYYLDIYDLYDHMEQEF